MNKKEQTGIIGFIARLVVSMIVIAITNILVPGMSNQGGLGNLALIAIVIAVIDYLLARFLGLSKAASGLTGFLVMALVLYLSGKVLDNFSVSVLGALIGGLVYGVVDSIIPGDRL